MSLGENSFKARVRDVLSDGRGVISNTVGKTCFVSGVWPGEEGFFLETGSKGKTGIAKLVKLTKVSPHRLTAPCKFHGDSERHCGGCPWQFMEYSAQLQQKQIKIAQSLEKFVCAEKIKTIQPSELIFGYRNRAQFKTDGLHLGYFAAKSNTLVPIDDCLILTEPNRDSLRQLRATLPNPKWRSSATKKRKGKYLSLDIDDNTSADKASIDSRLPFRQANTMQNNAMRCWLKKIIAVWEKGLTLLELYCGSGNFTRVLVNGGFRKILAVDVDACAVSTLGGMHYPGLEVCTEDLFDSEAIKRVLHRAKKTHVLVADPPRDGIKNLDLVLRQLKHLKKIVYISCDLATFTRDLKIILDSGFKIIELQPLDQCPHTPHVELMAYLCK